MAPALAWCLHVARCCLDVRSNDGCPAKQARRWLARKRGRSTLDRSTAHELDESAVVLGARGAVAEVLGDGRKGFRHLPASELALDVLGEARERSLAT